ncbi:MAG: hypothetical protein ACRELE_10135 [Gemmatimonadales bacterium]
MPNLFPGALGDSGRYAVPASVTNVINDKGEAMRKFLMAAALLAVAACGEKKAASADSTATMAPVAPAAMSAMDSMKADTMKKDSIRTADSAKAADSMKMAAPKKP